MAEKLWGHSPAGLFGYGRGAGARRSHEIINYEQVEVYEALLATTAGREPDACIDAVGLEAHGHGALFAIDRTSNS